MRQIPSEKNSKRLGKDLYGWIEIEFMNNIAYIVNVKSKNQKNLI